MKKGIHKWYSPNLGKDMEIAIYGHYGTPLLMFPTAEADYLEYERFDLIKSIKQIIDSGRFKVFSINYINTESWLNDSIHPPYKSLRHGQYNQYVIEEVVPFIYDNCNGQVPIITSGVSLGAYHAANTFFRGPSIFRGMIAMSGVYDLKIYTKGHFDDHVYFNSPIDYLPNITDETYLNQMRDNLGIVITSGQGEFEDPSAAVNLSNVLNSKGIMHWLDLWGSDMKHDWSTWREMLPYFLNKF